VTCKKDISYLKTKAQQRRKFYTLKHGKPYKIIREAEARVWSTDVFGFWKQVFVAVSSMLL